MSHFPSIVNETLVAVGVFVQAPRVVQALQDYSMLLLALCLMKIVVRAFPTGMLLLAL